MTLLSLLKSKNGLCVEKHFSCKQKAATIKLIIDSFFRIDGFIERRKHCDNVWEICQSLPTKFNKYRYRFVDLKNEIHSKQNIS